MIEGLDISSHNRLLVNRKQPLARDWHISGQGNIIWRMQILVK